MTVTPDALVKEMGGSESSTTNNRMEITAAILALREVKSVRAPVRIYTDSVYLIRGITQWIWGWKKNGWKSAEGEDILNRDLWEALSSLLATRGSEGKVSWHYSRGHVGTPGNERCDEIAVGFSSGKWVNLYEGPLIKYEVPIFDIPQEEPLPEMKPKTEKVPAYSYLSYLGGEVWRHRDWTSCERRVKGQSGAKFKKAMSQSDETKILLDWGLSKNVKVRGE